MLGSMQYQVGCMLGDFSFLQIAIGDSSLYTLRFLRCLKPVTVAGSIGETLLHAPTAMLYHWNNIQFHNEEHHRELVLTPLVFTSYENY
jgi:hypothetical protein